MGKNFFSLAFAAALLALASSEASAFAFVCQAVGVRSVLGVEASTSLKPSWRPCTGAPVEAESAPSAIAFQAIEAFSR